MRQVRIDSVNVNTDAPLDLNVLVDDLNEPAVKTVLSPFVGQGRTLLHCAVVMSDHIFALEMRLRQDEGIAFRWADLRRPGLVPT